MFSSRACTNETLVRWYIAHSATPTPEVMVHAARVARVPVLKILVRSGGEVKGTNLVAEAALAELWGYPDRTGVIEFLLDTGAPIDSSATFTRPPSYPQFPIKKSVVDLSLRFSGAQTAYSIARVSRNHTLETLLLARGADGRGNIVVDEPNLRI
jgi:hypothetical protein